MNFFFVCFFSIRPTDPISGNTFDAKRKKGEGLIKNNISKSDACRTESINDGSTRDEQVKRNISLVSRSIRAHHLLRETLV